MDGKIDEKIAVSNEVNGVFDCVKAYGGKIFFLYSGSSFDNKTGVTSISTKGMYCYDGTTVSKILDKNVSDYTIDEDNNIIYYYVFDEGLHKLDITNKTDEIIFKADKQTTLCQISFDGKYITLENKRLKRFTKNPNIETKHIIIDTSGKLINTLPIGELDDTYFGDDKYSFAYDEENILYIPKDAIDSAKEYSKIKLPEKMR